MRVSSLWPALQGSPEECALRWPEGRPVPCPCGFEEKQKGSLELRKLADFIVIDRDVLTVPTDELKDIKVLETFVGGELVYQRP